MRLKSHRGMGEMYELREGGKKGRRNGRREKLEMEERRSD